MPQVGRAGLIAAARAGDLSAAEALLSTCQPDIRRYARRQCHAASDIDDAVQEVLLILYRRVHELRAVEAFSHWLFRVVDRVCLRLGRRLLRLPPSPLEEVEARLGLATRSDPELRLDLAAAIQSLPLPYREAILLRDVEELTIAEIAGRLSITKAAAKARLHRARALVREYILQ